MEELDLSRFILAFVFVVGLIGATAMILGRYGRVAKKILNPEHTSGRLQVVETHYLDRSRRLVLVRRDNVEHLLLLASDRETVIEQGIRKDNEK